MINRLRKTNHVPTGSGESAGFVVDSIGGTPDRPTYNVRESDGDRYLDGAQYANKTAAYTVNVREMGKTFGFNSTTAFKITLPAAASVPAGRVGFVVVQAAGSGAHSVDVPASDTIKGWGAAGAGGDQLDLTGLVAGDYVEFESDGGTKWNVVNAQSAIRSGDLGADVVTNAKVADGAISLEHLDSGITFPFRVIGGGIFTTAGGDANESITVTGVVGTDTAIVWVQKAGATPRTVDTITPGTGSVAVVLSGDPSTDHKLGYLVIRASA